jgi:dTDP-4-dehydrorhamnose 3,5-epimerase
LKFIATSIPDVKIIEPTVYGDHRGYFYESFRKDRFVENGISGDFVQDNQSLSKRGILRGLHFQKPPFAQGKLVRVIAGAVLDVAVDIRKKSKFYGQHIAVELSAENHKMLWVPEGFAHGFITLKDDTIFSYKCTAYYNKESEDAVRWNSPELAIDWDVEHPILSQKDESAQLFSDFISPF